MFQNTLNQFINTQTWLWDCYLISIVTSMQRKMFYFLTLKTITCAICLEKNKWLKIEAVYNISIWWIKHPINSISKQKYPIFESLHYQTYAVKPPLHKGHLPGNWIPIVLYYYYYYFNLYIKSSFTVSLLVAL